MVQRIGKCWVKSSSTYFFTDGLQYTHMHFKSLRVLLNFFNQVVFYHKIYSHISRDNRFLRNTIWEKQYFKKLFLCLHEEDIKNLLIKNKLVASKNRHYSEYQTDMHWTVKVIDLSDVCPLREDSVNNTYPPKEWLWPRQDVLLPLSTAVRLQCQATS
jgi:hypothetical protein